MLGCAALSANLQFDVSLSYRVVGGIVLYGEVGFGEADGDCEDVGWGGVKRKPNNNRLFM